MFFSFERNDSRRRCAEFNVHVDPTWHPLPLQIPQIRQWDLHQPPSPVYFRLVRRAEAVQTCSFGSGAIVGTHKATLPWSTSTPSRPTSSPCLTCRPPRCGRTVICDARTRPSQHLTAVPSFTAPTLRAARPAGHSFHSRAPSLAQPPPPSSPPSLPRRPVGGTPGLPATAIRTRQPDERTVFRPTPAKRQLEGIHHLMR